MTSPRRLIADTGPDGKSCIVGEEAIPLSGNPGSIEIANIWTGTAASADNGAHFAGGFAPFAMSQLSGPAYWVMIVEYAPGLGAADPGLHFTNTVDHFCVLEGQVVLVLESGDVVLRAGDICICRGAVHGWRNDSDAVCRMVTFVVPALPVERAGASQL